MRRTIGFVQVLLIIAGLGGVAAPGAADEVHRARVSFPAGTTGTTVSGRIKGYDSAEYLVGAGAGQTMRVHMNVDNGASYFNVFAPGAKPGASEAMFIGSTSGSDFEAKLKQDGDYLIQVYIMRSGARRGETANYHLEVSVTGGSTAEAAPAPDFADGMSGGPDFWQVTGLSAGDTLNLRAEPSARAKVLGSFGMDTALRNRGCRMAGGQRWCQVENQSGALGGWVAGRYLREAGPEAYAAASAGDATVAGTGFNATGTVPCTAGGGQPTTQCAFGVTRQVDGNATVLVTLQDGRKRAIFFQGGRPTGFERSAADGDAGLEASRDSDLNLIRIGSERYEIPDVVVSGD